MLKDNTAIQTMELTATTTMVPTAIQKLDICAQHLME